MAHPFIQKLRNGAALTPQDEAALLDLVQPSVSAGARTELAHDGDELRAIPIIASGWACRFKLLENGKKQILSLLLPGDLCQPFGILPRFMENTLASLTPIRFARVTVQKLRKVAADSPRIEEALWWDLLSSTAIERERLVSVGRRSALERIGHLLCELHLRMKIVGLGDGMRMEIPLTQADFGDLLGLTSVHVNRTLRELRHAGLISLDGRQLEITNLKVLKEVSLFDPGYLHLEGAMQMLPGSTDIRRSHG